MNVSPLARVFALINKLAGLVHDIGKVNKQFQAGMQGELSIQRLRHDVLGALMFKHVVGLAVKATKASNDIAWLKEAGKGAQAFFASLTDVNGNLIIPELGAPDGKAAEIATALGLHDTALTKFLFHPVGRARYPALMAVYFLTLTHHHLIRKDEERDTPSLWRHVHDHVEFKTANLVAAGRMPWECEAWSRTFEEACQELAGLLESHPDCLMALANDSELFTTVVTQVLRPSLIVADQLTSVMQADVTAAPGRQFEPGQLYANLHGEDRAPGDTLETHLVNVGNRCESVLGTLLFPNDATFASPAKPAADSLLFSQPAPDSRFAWQANAERAITAVDGMAQSPFFAAVLSAPGSGKTPGGPRILRAAGGDCRFTLAVGRRSLTLQSGAAYESVLKYNRKDIAVLVGDAASRLLFDDNTASSASPQAGSECLAAGEELLMQEEHYLNGRTRGQWLQDMQPAGSVTAPQGAIDTKRIELIDAPIVVATVDHLVGAVALTRTKDSQLLLRIANSDLILDELDDFSASDLVTIGKLVHLYGVYGRRVIVMSGTLNDFLVKHMHSLWQRGLTVHRALTGNKAPSYSALISNLTPPVILKSAPEATFAAAATLFAQSFSASLAKAPVKSRVQVLDMPEGDDFAWKETLLRSCQVMHDYHHNQDPKTGTRVSLGVVRFNSVAHAQDFARHLYSRVESSRDVMTRVICYHAKYPTFVRALIERQLDTLLMRESHAMPEGQLFPEVTLLRQAIDEAVAANKRDLTVIVCTTSIEETGRNHDFDYAITEPHSERSLAQLAGRVMRHRAGTPRVPNVLVMSATVNALTGKGLPYGHSGIQDRLFENAATWLVDAPKEGSALARALAHAKLKVTEGEGVPTLSARDLLPLAQFEESVTPAPVLVAPVTYGARKIAALEHIETFSALESALPGRGLPMALGQYLGSASSALPLQLTSVHSEQVVFRDSDLPTEEICMRLRGDALSFVKDEVTIRHVSERIPNPERDFLKLEINWRLELQKYSVARSWSPDAALSVLGRARCAWRAKEENFFNAGMQAFRFSFSTGISKLRS